MKIELTKTELEMLLYLSTEIKDEVNDLQVFDEKFSKESFDNLHLKLNNLKEESCSDQ